MHRSLNKFYRQSISAPLAHLNHLNDHDIDIAKADRSQAAAWNTLYEANNYASKVLGDKKASDTDKKQSIKYLKKAFSHHFNTDKMHMGRVRKITK